MKRKKMSKKWRKKIGKAHLGRKCSEETKRRISLSKMGDKNGSWKGGRKYQDGYVYILCKNHPNCSYDGYVAEHRLVMEAHLGRYLLSTEIVHHINGVRDDNRIENLALFSRAEHVALHTKGRKASLSARRNMKAAQRERRIKETNALF